MSEMIVALSAIFVTAGAMLLIANRLSLPTVPFYIFAGIVAGTIVPETDLLELAQWGIAFLVFVFGAELDLPKLSGVFRDSEATAAAQLVVLGPVGFGLGLTLGLDSLNAVYFAIAVVLSSTVIGTGLLEMEIHDNLLHGRLAKSVHLLDDFIAIAAVSVLSASVFTGDAIAAKIGYGVVILLLGLLVQRHVFEHLIRLSDGSQELLMIAAISVLICFLTFAEAVGISPVVGAFAAGLAIHRDPSRNLGMLNGIESIKDFFVVVFFVTLGALVSYPTMDVFVMASVLILLTAVLKPAVTMAALLLEGYDVRTATLTSASLDQISEFALIIAIQGLLVGQLAPSLFDAIILAAAVTMITSTLTRRYDEWLFLNVTGPLLGDMETRKIDEQSAVPDGISDHVIVLGYGRIGRRIVDACESEHTPYVVVENDPAKLPAMRAETTGFVAGDAMYGYTWSLANIEEARLVISTVDQRRVSERLLELETETEIVLRSSDGDVADRLREAGASYVIIPDELAADRLEEVVTELLEPDVDRAAIKRRHLRSLDQLEEQGLGARRMHDEASTRGS